MAFNPEAYLAANPDVAKSGMSAEYHYNNFGQYEGRDPGGATSGAQTNFWDNSAWQNSVGYDEKTYLGANQDIAKSVQSGNGFKSGAAHYAQYGQYEGRKLDGSTSGAQQSFYNNDAFNAANPTYQSTYIGDPSRRAELLDMIQKAPRNNSWYQVPVTYNGQEFNVNMNIETLRRLQKQAEEDPSFDLNGAILRASGDGIGVGDSRSDGGFDPRGYDIRTGKMGMHGELPYYYRDTRTAGASGGGGYSGGGGGYSGGGGGSSGGIIGSQVGGGFQPWNVTSPQTAQGQIAGIIASDSPLMQQARGRAMQQMNERGLINSSLAAQAAQDAVMDRAIQIGSQDASVNASAAQFNANQQNAWNLAQQEFDYKRWALMQDFENQKQLQEVESKYSQQLNSDANFQKQYAMYIETLFQIDMNTALDPETKLQMKKQRAQELDDYIAINKLGINMDFSDYWDAKIAAAPAPTPTPPAPYVDTSGA